MDLLYTAQFLFFMFVGLFQIINLFRCFMGFTVKDEGLSQKFQILFVLPGIIYKIKKFVFIFQDIIISKILMSSFSSPLLPYSHFPIFPLSPSPPILISPSPHLRISPSPHLPIFPSPRLPLSLSPHLPISSTPSTWI